MAKRQIDKPDYELIDQDGVRIGGALDLKEANARVESVRRRGKVVTMRRAVVFNSPRKSIEKVKQAAFYKKANLPPPIPGLE